MTHWTTRAAKYYIQLQGKKRPYRPYRCGNCRHAKVLNRELWEYLQPPSCPLCHSVDWRLDMSRYYAWLHQKPPFNVCHCDGAHFPHRKGSVPLCIHRTELPSSYFYQYAG